MIDIGPLKVFAVIGDVGSFSKAAALLGVSQSAVSQSLSQLERQYGVTLVDRSDRRHIRLTPKGEVLLSFARSILSQSDSLDFVFTHYDALREAEEVKIAFSQKLVAPLAGRVLSALYAVVPQIQAIVCTTEGGVEADLYVTEEGIRSSENFSSHPLCAYLLNILRDIRSEGDTL